jgi:hypothetical protein
MLVLTRVVITSPPLTLFLYLERCLKVCCSDAGVDEGGENLPLSLLPAEAGPLPLLLPPFQPHTAVRQQTYTEQRAYSHRHTLKVLSNEL